MIMALPAFSSSGSTVGKEPQESQVHSQASPASKLTRLGHAAVVGSMQPQLMPLLQSGVQTEPCLQHCASPLLVQHIGVSPPQWCSLNMEPQKSPVLEPAPSLLEQQEFGFPEDGGQMHSVALLWTTLFPPKRCNCTNPVASSGLQLCESMPQGLSARASAKSTNAAATAAAGISRCDFAIGCGEPRLPLTVSLFKASCA
mmetsp:Transcript_53653/g.136212  ORF Transcript_53653/g.136212 Transcript_53653/m.136212 type:complete len:200 (+) Transcript_53653:1114-1713(+)